MRVRQCVSCLSTAAKELDSPEGFLSVRSESRGCTPEGSSPNHQGFNPRFSPTRLLPRGICPHYTCLIFLVFSRSFALLPLRSLGFTGLETPEVLPYQITSPRPWEPQGSFRGAWPLTRRGQLRRLSPPPPGDSSYTAPTPN